MKRRMLIFYFMVWFKEKFDGNSPSNRVAALGAGLTSAATSRAHLDNLVADGLLKRIAGGTNQAMMVNGGYRSAIPAMSHNIPAGLRQYWNEHAESWITGELKTAAPVEQFLSVD